MNTTSLRFGPFRLIPDQRLLLAGGQPVRLGSRALDLLIALTERPGETVGKRDLMSRVWPGVVVEEANLRVNVAALRKALGDSGAASRYVVSVPGRGYTFVAPVEYVEGHASATLLPRMSAATTGRPPVPAGIIGREDACRGVAELLRDRRFVSLLGPGGMGKTTVAVAVADRLAPIFEDGVFFVDLATLPESAAASSVLAALLGISVYSDDPVPGIIARLRDGNALIVLDNCEHVIESAACLAETLVRDAPRVSVLATSREPLRVAGEWQYLLGPLEAPSPGAEYTVEQALQFPATRLFVDRAKARSPTLALADEDVATIVGICRRLDGIPLAIELAAAVVGLIGLHSLAAALGNHLDLLTRGRRTALPRHRTLRATLDWSYDLLSPTEQAVFCRLALFAGSFDAAAVLAVIGDENLPESALTSLGGLVEKSLVAADGSPRCVRYRLLETTREYAREKLGATNGAGVARRHAAYVTERFSAAEADWERQSREDWLSVYARQLDDARAVLDRSYRENGDTETAIRLTLSIAPVLMVLSLWDECRQWLGKALEVLEGRTGAAADAQRMRLGAALGLTLLQTLGTGPELTKVWLDTGALAKRLGDHEHLLRACLGLWICRPPDGHYEYALRYAEEFRRIADETGQGADVLVGHKLVASAQFILGRQTEARREMETMLRDYRRRRSDIMRFQSDQLVTGRCFYGLNLWLLGYPDQALAITNANSDDARSLGHAVAELYALIFGSCQVAALNGNLPVLERGIPLLEELSSRCVRWSIWQRYFMGLALRLQGRTGEAAASLQSTLGMLPETAYHFLLVPLLAEAARTLAAAGDPAEGRLRIGKAIAHAERNGEYWIMPELLRIRGDVLLQTGDGSGAALLEQSLDLARGQEALSWQLRSALSLATHWRTLGMAERGRALVSDVLGRFTEGAKTADHVAARKFLSLPDAPASANGPSAARVGETQL